MISTSPSCTGPGWRERPEVLLLFAVLGLLGLLIAQSPLESEELWWRLATGHQIAKTGSVPSTNLYAYSVPAATPYVHQGWLADLIFYELYRQGGLAMLALLSSVLLTLGYGLLALVVWRESSGSVSATVLALLVAALLGFDDWSLSSRTFALPLLGGMLLIVYGTIGHHYSSRTLVLLPLIMASWANLDGSFIVGVVALVGLVGGTLLDQRRREPVLALAPLRPLLFATLIALGATMINPRGPRLLADSWQTLSALPNSALGYTWHPPTIANDIKGSLFFISLLLLPLLGRWRCAGLSARHLLVLLGVTWLALDSWRTVILYGLPLAVVLGVLLRPTVPRDDRAALRLVPLVLLALIPALLAVGLRWGKVSAASEEQALTALVSSSSSGMAAETPIAVVAALGNLRRQGVVKGHLFHPFVYSSYLMWALPEEQTFVDPRLTMFGDQLWGDYMRIQAACDLELLFERYEVRRVMVDKQQQPQLHAAMRAATGWTMAYEDAWAALFFRP